MPICASRMPATPFLLYNSFARNEFAEGSSTVKTGSWFTALLDDHIKIGISRGVPRRMSAGYRLYKRLNPGPWFNSVEPDEYDRLYQEQVLASLDPGRVHDEIMALSRGKIPVLCWFERPGTGQTCHRPLVSEWFANTLRLVVPEFGFEGASVHPPQMRLTQLRQPAAPG